MDETYELLKRAQTALNNMLYNDDFDADDWIPLLDEITRYIEFETALNLVDDTGIAYRSAKAELAKLEAKNVPA